MSETRAQWTMQISDTALDISAISPSVGTTLITSLRVGVGATFSKPGTTATSCTYSDDQVRSMFLDCVKASKKINKELEEGQIIQQGFLQVCELYGLHMQVQSTVVTKGGSPAGVRGK